MSKINYNIFLPPIIVLVLVLGGTLHDAVAITRVLQYFREVILLYFDWLFNLTVFSFGIICLIIYFSPLGKQVIGGPDSKPILDKKRWFAVVLCTTVATGILFWGSAEPLFHLHEPPSYNITPSSKEAAVTSMSALFMNWTIPPYALYTSVSLLFAWSYYNKKRPFRVSSVIFDYKQNKSRWFHDVVDSICLLSLVGGMAASLGAGVLTISGGLDRRFSFSQGPELWTLITVAIVLAFVISAASGIQRGIKWLSQINVLLFIALIVIFTYSLMNADALIISLNAIPEFIVHFVPRSLGISDFDRSWEQAWMSFYWANWMAWAPVTALFLGRLGVGYSVRAFIRVNLLYTSLFSALWMCIFGGIALSIDMKSNGILYEILVDSGPQDVLFELISRIPFAPVISILFLIVVYVSYVTAADSNTSAMSGLSARDVNPDHPEASLVIKMIWGSFIAVLALIMIITGGIEGIKTISILGGFPILFLCLAVLFRLSQWVYASMKITRSP